MRDIDSDVLRLVGSVLQIGRPATITVPSQFDDDVLQQVLDVGPIIRRSVVPQRTDGLFVCQIQNVHTAANVTLTTSEDPYAPVTQCAAGLNLQASGLYPVPVPKELDVWLLAATAILSSGATANFDSALLSLSLPVTSQGWGCTTGAPGGAAPIVLAAWDAAAFFPAGQVPKLFQVGTGAISVRLDVRVPRGATIDWTSRNANSTAIDTRVKLLVGLSASGLGQDFAF